jgi:hypothetical protein
LARAVQTAARTLEWAVASRPYPGEASSGDASLVKSLSGGVLVAVVDALGHGKDAAPTASTAVAVVDRYAHEPLPSILERCHRELIGTRGAVMSLASFQPADHAMSWLGVGNVDGFLVSAEPKARTPSRTLITRSGIVGGDLPKITPSVVPLIPGDILTFSTDGVRTGFADSVTSAESPQEIADRVITHYAKGTDDALVLVVRYLGDR